MSSPRPRLLRCPPLRAPNSSPLLRQPRLITSGFPRQVSLPRLHHEAALVAQANSTTTLSAPSRGQVRSWVYTQKRLSIAVRWPGPRGRRSSPDAAVLLGGEAEVLPEGGRAARLPGQPVMPMRLLPACPLHPRNLKHPIVSPGGTPPRPPPSSPTFRRPLRCARTAGRPPPVLCKAKEDALLGLKKRDNTSQPAPWFRAGVLQKDATGDPRERHFHM